MTFIEGGVEVPVSGPAGEAAKTTSYGSTSITSSYGGTPTTQDEEITVLEAKVADLTAQVKSQTSDPVKAARISDLNAQIANLEAQLTGTAPYKGV